MDLSGYQPYIFPALIAGYLAFRVIRAAAVKKRVSALAARGAVFVDVRTAEEFAAGNKPGSLNIPFEKIALRTKELDRDRPIVLSCVSGTRSGMAAGMLRAMGFKDVTNAGSWKNTL